MNYKVLYLFVFLIGFGVNAQIPSVKKTKCYEKAAKSGRFADWECGKLAGAVDCNEKLIYDDITETIMAGKTGTPFTGICETCHLNGLLERRITFVNGKEQGVDTTFYKSGCPQVIRNHINGYENGKWVYYYDSTGNLAWEMNYNLGQLHGPQLYLTKRGDTTRFENYNMGKLHGVKKTYFTKSILEKEVYYKNGLMDGSYRSYTFDGKLLEDLSYKEGKKNGELKYYYFDGTLLSVEHWNMDIKEGEFRTYFYNGKIQILENYHKGIFNGWCEEHYPDEKMKRNALYKKGVIIEEHRFNEAGEETYTFGVEQPKSTEDDEMPGTKKKKKRKSKEGPTIIKE